MDAPVNLWNKMMYEIRIDGCLQKKWTAWLNGMAIETSSQDGNNVTIIKGVISDQAAMRGLLNKLWDLNLTIISLNRIRDKGDA